jgi:glycosyltransferase involved in cell wall biosynthesis
MIIVCHLTTVHRLDDTRILFKQCHSLAAAGYDVRLIGIGEEGIRKVGSVRVEAVPARSTGRLFRMVWETLRVLSRALRANAAVYHFHDPELIPAGLLLRLLGKRVVYDVHEDVPNDILVKYWIPAAMRQPIAWFAALAERVGGRCFSAIVAATPAIAQRFPTKRTVVVQNLPIKTELLPKDDDSARRQPWVAYVGVVTALRGAREMVQAIAGVHKFPEARLVIGGNISPTSLIDQLTAMPGWSRTEFRGWLDRPAVRDLLSRARVGLVLVHPTQCYLESYPVKLFEYMAAGLPVIASDFPLWRSWIVDQSCGICVRHDDVCAIAAAIEWIFEHPDEAEAMGRRGRAFIENGHSWESEAETLLELYRRLTNAPQSKASA